MPKRKKDFTCSEDDADQPVKKRRGLEEENAELKKKVSDYQERLSHMASQRMRQGNTCVEDLNDPFRPSALADMWNGFFRTGEYWTAYEKVSKVKKNDEDTAEYLLKVTKTVWTTCVDFVEDLVPKIVVQWSSGPENEESYQQTQETLPEVRRKYEELLPQDASRVDNIVKTLAEEYNGIRENDVPILQQKLRKAVLLLPKTAEPPKVLMKKVTDAIKEDETADKDVQVEEVFLRQLANLCYLMRLQEIPLWVSFDFSPGSPFDPAMFEVDSSTPRPPKGVKIKSILRPPLLRSKGGAVLSKGEADVEPAKSR